MPNYINRSLPDERGCKALDAHNPEMTEHSIGHFRVGRGKCPPYIPDVSPPPASGWVGKRSQPVNRAALVGSAKSRCHMASSHLISFLTSGFLPSRHIDVNPPEMTEHFNRPLPGNSGSYSKTDPVRNDRTFNRQRLTPPDRKCRRIQPRFLARPVSVGL